MGTGSRAPELRALGFPSSSFTRNGSFLRGKSIRDSCVTAAVMVAGVTMLMVILNGRFQRLGYQQYQQHLSSNRLMEKIMRDPFNLRTKEGFGTRRLPVEEGEVF